VLENRENIILKNTPLTPLKGGISNCPLEDYLRANTVSTKVASAAH
tara:strand:+ start:29118 stop:29255 length:138 start_codon:yes stop_codon:yes gene_type:complete